MKYLSNRFIFLILALGACTPVVQAEESLPSLYDLYREFMDQNGGQKNMNSLNSVIVRGHIDQDGQVLNFRLYRKRPNKMRITVKLEDLEISTVFDGKQAWREVTNDSDLVALTRIEGEELASIKKDSIFDSPFYGAFEQREWITVAGIEDVNGKEAIRLDFDPKGDFGFRHLWLSMDHYQEVKMLRDFNSKDPGPKEDEAIYYQGFERINGVYWAKLMRHFVDGELSKEVFVDDLMPNAGVFDSYFEIDETKEADAR